MYKYECIYYLFLYSYTSISVWVNYDLFLFCSFFIACLQSGVDIIELAPEENCLQQSLYAGDSAVVVSGTALVTRPKNVGSRDKEVIKVLFLSVSFISNRFLSTISNLRFREYLVNWHGRLLKHQKLLMENLWFWRAVMFCILEEKYLLVSVTVARILKGRL